LKRRTSDNSSVCHTATWPSWGRNCLHRAVAAALACCLFATPLLAKNSRPGEYEVKAVYLLNFGKFLSWPTPPADSKTFPICVLGQDPFGAALETTLAGEKIEGESVVARRLQKPQDALNCRILFISTSEEAHLGAILDVLGDAPVLTVSDLPDFALRGGMIQFVLEEDRVRFSVNLAAAENARLTLSSQLLKVASSVQRNVRVRDRQ
jgi:YfiR/HmsC-like